MMKSETQQVDEKLSLESENSVSTNIATLVNLFPQVKTEGKKIDFEKLKLLLGEHIDFGKERYTLNWPGKVDCFKAIQAPSSGTLRPHFKDSLNFDSTENLFIEGDNLQVLKLLQKSYLDKIKMIYIDPPYNTGNDFLYPDDFNEDLITYLKFTGQVDEQGKKFSTNQESDGRFHSKWLSMMYPRLYLAKNLLTENGVILVSIGDNEYRNLLFIMNEIFGEENFITSFCWKARAKPTNAGNSKYRPQNVA
ncbi:MAG: site-specific DNA-methyltransferase, partial [Bdellovibrionales bacterium]